MVFPLVKPDVEADINSEYSIIENAYEDRVVFDFGQKKSQDSTVIITINCADKIGLASDIIHIILEFGLDVTRAGQ